jgi:signal peptidase I
VLVADYFINPFHANSRDPRARVLGFLIYRMPSRSMLPTLHVGVIMSVDTWALAQRDPQRGEIIVFRYPPNPEVSYVKRVIGLGGETIEVREGQVYIDGKALSEPYLPEIPVDPYPSRDYSATQIPAGTYFVMGDNRNNSEDSRFWGTVPRALIVGTVTPNQ